MAKLSKLKDLFKGKKGKRNLVIVGGIAIAYFVLRGGGEGGESPLIDLEPAEVTKGELVSATSKRIIASRRPGMSYVPAEGPKAGEISFTPDKNGWFTRNVVEEGGQLWAEIK